MDPSPAPFPPPPPPPAAPAPAGGCFRVLANLAWISVPVSFFWSIMMRTGSTVNHTRADALAEAILAGLPIVAGIGCGIVALCAIPKYGPKGLLRPALVGLFFWLILAALAFPVFQNVQRRAAKIHAAQAQRIDLTPATHAPGAERLQDAELAFSFDLPAGYQPVPAGSLPKQFRYVYIRPVAGEAASAIMVTFLGGTILPSDHLRPEHMPPGQGTTLTTFSWRGLPVDGLRVLEKSPQGEFVTFNVQLPLKNRAVQIGFGGPVAREAEIHALATETLSTLEGEPNWP